MATAPWVLPHGYYVMGTTAWVLRHGYYVMGTTHTTPWILCRSLCYRHSQKRWRPYRTYTAAKSATWQLHGVTQNHNWQPRPGGGPDGGYSPEEFNQHGINIISDKYNLERTASSSRTPEELGMCPAGYVVVWLAGMQCYDVWKTVRAFSAAPLLGTGKAGRGTNAVREKGS